MPPFEFLIPKRPLSHQAKNADHKQDWKNFVFGRAFQIWKGVPVSSGQLRFTLVYLCEADPADINNIIKPVQDALTGLVYVDDRLVIDVQGHLRMTDELLDVTGLPPMLQEAIIAGVDCLYVRIDYSQKLDQMI